MRFDSAIFINRLRNTKGEKYRSTWFPHIDRVFDLDCFK